MKPTKLRSRRRTALRRIAIAAVVYLLITHIVPVVGAVLPCQALWQSEERSGTGRTSVITRRWSPDAYRPGVLYLTENENVTFLSNTYWAIYGWQAGSGLALDCSKELPLYAGWMHSYARTGYVDVRYYFGRVDDPDICRIDILLEYETWENGTVERREGARFAIPDNAWMEKDGRQYFLIKSPEQEWPYESRAKPVAVGYDPEGGEVTRLDIDEYLYEFH